MILYYVHDLIFGFLPNLSVQQEFDIESASPFLIKRIDEHVYLRFTKKHSTFWTTSTHLEISSFEKGKSTIHGVFGPSPTLWTFFMFIHFVIGTLFLILGALAYSKYSLNQPITPLLIGMACLVLLWIGLYVFGRLGKAKGKPQMQQLRQYADTLFIQIQKKVRRIDDAQQH